MSSALAIPYVVGQWVRGEQFYGRRQLLAEVLEGPRQTLWIVGTRRVGKTSLLRQLEHLATSRQLGYAPLFWDFQGAEDAGELAATLGDALYDAEERFTTLGLKVRELAGEDIFSVLGRLRRHLRSQGLTLLLLCDEVEELIRLARREPALLRKLRHALQAQEGIRSVLASTVRLGVLAEETGDTSPFLHGFTPPLFLAGLADDETLALIHQDQLPIQARPRFSATEVRSIARRSGNHPFLTQLLAKRLLERGDLKEALELVAADRMVAQFHANDFALLADPERQILEALALREPTTSESLGQLLELAPRTVAGALLRLEGLGLVHRTTDRQLEVANDFFRRWLQERAPCGDARAPASELADPSAAEPSTEHYSLPLSKLAGRYQILEQVGEGGSAVVYSAYDDLLRSKVAVKLLKPRLGLSGRTAERVRREILLARDIGHPHIARVYDVGVTGDQTFLTMQWLGGGTLARLLQEGGPLPWTRAVKIGTKLTSAVAAAHRRDVLHRDIKPSNVLFDGAGEPHLADFGLAEVIVPAGAGADGYFVGTPFYASPEQAALQALDERSDLYSLGILIFEMVTGRRPFEAPTVQAVLEMQRTAPPPDLREIAPAIPSELGRLVLRCLAKKPHDRVASAEELESALLPLLDS